MDDGITPADARDRIEELEQKVAPREARPGDATALEDGTPDAAADVPGAPEPPD
jgi:hypothetical protein